MKELPDISNETQLVQDWLTMEVNSNVIAEKYNMNNGHLVGAKVRRERKTPNLTINSKEELLDILELVPGKITLGHWLGLSPAKTGSLINKYLLPDDLLTNLYVEKGMSNKEITEYINHPYAPFKIVQDRIKRLHLKHKEGDKEAIRMKGIADYLSDEERVNTRNERQLKTMKEKYGVESISPFDIDDVKMNRLTWHETKYVKTKEQLYDLVQANPVTGELDKLMAFLSGLIAAGEFTKVNSQDIANIIGVPISTINNYTTVGKLVADGKVFVENYRGAQNEVAKFIELLGIDKKDIKIDKRPKEMNNQQLDIYIPKYNFAIEFNGNYWHANLGKSLREPKPVSYHKDKTELARKAGINLMHIWEYDWNDEIKQEIVKSQIKYHLGKIDKSNRYYARKLSIKSVSYVDTNAFLTKNHIQGMSTSSERYGLYNGDELLALMTFGKRRFDNKDGWELLRFATKLNTSVAGGASKLLRVFANNHKGDTLISYANNDFAYSGNKSLYSKLGFDFIKSTEPGYKWVKNSNKVLVVPRYSVQPFKLKAFTAGTGRATFKGEVPDYQEDDTENSYMVRHSFYKVYDAGNDLYEKVL